jgi:hypothetical protein
MERSNLENNARKDTYISLFKEVFTNSISILVVLLVCKLVVFILDGKISAFDSALSVLLHYGKDSISILFLTSSSMLLLAVSLIFEPAYLAIWFRKYVSVPALSISGHMLSMSAGATIGWYFIVAIENSFNFYTFAQVTFIYLVCLCFSFICLSAKPFFEYDFGELKIKNEKVFTVFTILMGGVSTAIMYFGYVYNFNSIATAH